MFCTFAFYRYSDGSNSLCHVESENSNTVETIVWARKPILAWGWSFQWWLFRSPATQLFIQQFGVTSKKHNIKGPHCWPLVKGIHRCPVDSPHKGPIMQKAFPFHDIIMARYDNCFYPIGCNIFLCIIRLLRSIEFAEKSKEFKSLLGVLQGFMCRKITIVDSNIYEKKNRHISLIVMSIHS